MRVEGLFGPFKIIESLMRIMQQKINNVVSATAAADGTAAAGSNGVSPCVMRPFVEIH